MRKIGKYMTGYVPRGRYVNPQNIPFKAILPLKLRNHVSSKGENTSNVACIQEMSVLFACLKRNDFKETRCAQEISTFQKCYNDHTEQKKEKEEKERRGVLIPGEKKLSHKQANELLKKFPS